MFYLQTELQQYLKSKPVENSFVSLVFQTVRIFPFVSLVKRVASFARITFIRLAKSECYAHVMLYDSCVIM